MEGSVPLQFVPMITFPDVMFWKELARRKLNEWKLDESPVEMIATYTNYDSAGSSSCRLSLSYDAFVNASGLETGDDKKGVWKMRGTLVLSNTVDAFQKIDRAVLLAPYFDQIFHVIMDGDWMKDPAALNVFVFPAYADLKNHMFYYWNAIPCADVFERVALASAATPLPREKTQSLISMRRELGNVCAFLLANEKPMPLTALEDDELKSEDVTVVYVDPSTNLKHPGWPMRNLLAAVAFAKVSWTKAKFIALREGNVASIVLDVVWTLGQMRSIAGWERNLKGQIEKPFTVDLRLCFDDVMLAVESVELNLRLIRWRLVPDIDLKRFTDLRCLILGAGTLGCNIARALLGWGVQNFTFVDNSKVAFSNPVRQSLFQFEDSVDGGKRKAEAAADALLRIYPNLKAVGHTLTIPMPGHTVSSSEEGKARHDFKLLLKLITSHDVVFLVMDSREARWLPTLLAAAHGKLAFSVALGFDSYVVIRHGFENLKAGVFSFCACGLPVGEDCARSTGSHTEASFGAASGGDPLLIPGSMLGCYFCSDITAPANSSVDRTLDQHCTVTRAGVSQVASGMATELLASVLQHPLGGEAPAKIGEIDESSSVLGATPHQIRAFISRFHQMTPAVRRFERCVACGEGVRREYGKHGFDFLLKVFNDPKYLEKVAGLEELQLQNGDIWEFEDNESVSSS